MLDVVGQDHVAAGDGGNSEDVWFCETYRMAFRRRGAFLTLNVKMLGWNVSVDLFLFLSQTSMFTTWMLKSGVGGAHELFLPETLCCQVRTEALE